MTESLREFAITKTSGGLGSSYGPKAFGGTESPYWKMPHHYSCCVPLCFNNFRNSPDLHYYRIPKNPKPRQTYKVILKNDALKLDSESTRICSAHFEGGKKSNRSHLPSIFPWTQQKLKRRELNRVPVENCFGKKRKISQVDSQDVAEKEEPVARCHGEREETRTTTCEATATENVSQADQESQTELNVEGLLCDVESLRKEYEELKQKCTSLQQEVKKLKFCMQNRKFDIEKYKDSDNDISFYTGFPNYGAMQLCFQLVEESAKNMNYEYEKVCPEQVSNRPQGRPRSLTLFQEFTLVLMRLRLGLFEKDLSHRFGVSVMTVSRVVRTWLRFLRLEFEPLISIPARPVIKKHMPEIFKNLLPDTTVIVDCTEIEMEKPSSLDGQSACYSSYKRRTTMKALLGITPSGVVCFVSEFFPGSTSDKEITVKSGFLNKLQVGDQVLADKGFNCQDELASVGATLVIPAFLKQNKQFTTQQGEHNKTVAGLRVHVERLMERLKNWHVFDHRIPISLHTFASDMLIVVTALSNFHPPLIG